MSAKFDQEKQHVLHLMQWLALDAQCYEDPNDRAGYETGADVLVTAGGRRIGVQVTVLDPNRSAGRARAAEKALAKKTGGRPYGTWGQNDPLVVTAAIANAVARKVMIATNHSFADFDELWLLVVCGATEWGAVASTFVMTPWLDVGAMEKATGAELERSRYDRAFVHPELGVEKTLYAWTPGQGWQKTVRTLPPEQRGPNFWDVIRDPEWTRDPEAKCSAEIAKVLAEFQEKRGRG